MSLTIWSSKISLVAGPARPSNQDKPCKQWFPNFRRDNLEHDNSVAGRPSKDHEPSEMEPQYFIRGMPSKDHKPDNLEFQDFTCDRPSQAQQPPQTLKTEVPKLHPRRFHLWQVQPATTTNLEKQRFQNFIRDRPSKDHKPGNDLQSNTDDSQKIH